VKRLVAALLALTLAACDGAEPPAKVTLPADTPEDEIYAHCLEEARALATWEQPNLASRPEYGAPDDREATHYTACLTRHGLR